MNQLGLPTPLVTAKTEPGSTVCGTQGVTRVHAGRNPTRAQLGNSRTTEKQVTALQGSLPKELLHNP